MVLNIESKIERDIISDYTQNKEAFWRKGPFSYFEALKDEKDEYTRMLRCEGIIRSLAKLNIVLSPSGLFKTSWKMNGKEVEGLIRKAQTRIRFAFSGVLKLSELSTSEYIYMFIWDGVKRNELIDLIKQEQSGQKPSPIQFNLLKRFENLMSPKKNEMKRFQNCEETIAKLTRKGIPVNPRLLFNPERNLSDEETEVIIKKAQERIKLVFDDKLKLKELTTSEYVYLFFWDRIKREQLLNLINQESLGQKIHPNPFKPLSYFEPLMAEKDDVIKMVKCEKMIDKLKADGIKLAPHLIFNQDGTLNREQVNEAIQNAKNKIKLVVNGKLNPSELNTAEYVFMFLWKEGWEKFTIQEPTYKPKIKKKA